MQLRNGKKIEEDVVVIFDVETTGLVPKRKEYRGTKTELQSKSYYYDVPLPDFPYITQLCFVIYDLTPRRFELGSTMDASDSNLTGNLIEKLNLDPDRVLSLYSNYVKLPEGIDISKEASEKTGITREICEEKGVPIIDALIAFYRAVHRASRIIAHNYEFDHTVISIEMKRNMKDACFRKSCPNADRLLNSDYLYSRNIRTFCTMRAFTNICKIFYAGKTSGAYKWPRLEEVHQFLFGYKPENLHDAEVDVMTCLKCYLYLFSPQGTA
jgi:DNA polymerase III epsilon subunit-like protein